MISSNADSVEISGKVTGNISAKARVELKSDAKMIGDIQAPRILIADGALETIDVLDPAVPVKPPLFKKFRFNVEVVADDVGVRVPVCVVARELLALSTLR